jgi:hypothetical protein
MFIRWFGAEGSLLDCSDFTYAELLHVNLLHLLRYFFCNSKYSSFVTVSNKQFNKFFNLITGRSCARKIPPQNSNLFHVPM